VAGSAHEGAIAAVPLDPGLRLHGWHGAVFSHDDRSVGRQNDRGRADADGRSDRLAPLFGDAGPRKGGVGGAVGEVAGGMNAAHGDSDDAPVAAECECLERRHATVDNETAAAEILVDHPVGFEARQHPRLRPDAAGQDDLAVRLDRDRVGGGRRREAEQGEEHRGRPADPQPPDPSPPPHDHYG